MAQVPGRVFTAIRDPGGALGKHKWLGVAMIWVAKIIKDWVYHQQNMEILQL
jgi:hypothetical protein